MLTPEEDAKLTLGLTTPEKGMSASMTEVGAVGIMRAGMAQMLDIIPAIALSLPEALAGGSDKREGEVSRATKETSIFARVWLDGTGTADVNTVTSL